MTMFITYVGKKTKLNTMAKERRTLKGLKANPNVIVKQSDKCKCFVIMDRAPHMRIERNLYLVILIHMRNSKET